MGEVIVITSGKGWARQQRLLTSEQVWHRWIKKVILIDTDIGLRNLDVVMGLENRIVYNLVDVIEGNCRLKQAVIRDRKYPNLYLTFSTDEGQDSRQSGTDEKTHRRTER